MEAKYKAGDVVKIRQWDDMGDQYGFDIYTGTIRCPSGTIFDYDMEKFCGKYVHIRKSGEDSFGIYYKIEEDDQDSYYTDEMFEAFEINSFDKDLFDDSDISSFLDNINVI